MKIFRNSEIKVKSTVENLFTVLTGMKDEERACIEEVISKMAVSELPEGTAKYVWKLADKSSPEKQKVALQLIGILVKSDKDLRKYLRQMQAIVKDRHLPSKVRVEALSALANMADLVCFIYTNIICICFRVNTVLNQDGLSVFPQMILFLPL